MLAAQTESTQNIPITIFNTFLGVVLWGGDEKGEPVPLEVIADRLSMPPQTLSNHLRYLGDRYREDKEGMGLIELDTYNVNRRMKVAKLTYKGRVLADQLSFILQGDVHDSSRNSESV